MRLTDHDASFLYSETASGVMHSTVVTVLEGECDYETVLANTERRIHLVPRLRQRLVYVPGNIAHPKWVDDPDFDIKNHLKPYQVPEGTTLEEGIQIGMSLGEPLLPRDRSLWLNYVVEGISGYTLLVQLTHHAMIDGASMVEMSMVMFDLDADALPPGPPNEPWKPEPLLSPAELWTEALTENLQNIQSAMQPVTRNPGNERLLLRAGEVMQRFMTEPAMTASWNAGLVGPRRLYDWVQYPLSDFREIRRALGGTMNDIVLTVVTESAARYLAAHKETAENQYLRIMCPVNVRREGEEGSLGNRVSALYPFLPASPMDVGSRLAVVREELDRLKSNRDAQALELMQEATPSIPPMAMAQTLMVGTPFDPTALAARNPLPVIPWSGPRPPLVGFNFTCTNVPGVQMPQYVAGKKILAHHGLMMLSGTLGYGVSVSSYNQDMLFNFTSDNRLLPDLHVMRQGVADAFEELLELARSRKSDAA